MPKIEQIIVELQPVFDDLISLFEVIFIAITLYGNSDTVIVSLFKFIFQPPNYIYIYIYIYPQGGL